MSSEYRSAASSCARFRGLKVPTRPDATALLGIVTMLSQEITHSSLRPSSIPMTTSDEMPRMVREMGAHVMAVKTSMAASRVKTQTGRRPIRPPKSAQQTSPRITNLAWSPARGERRPQQSPDPGASSDMTPDIAGRHAAWSRRPAPPLPLAGVIPTYSCRAPKPVGPMTPLIHHPTAPELAAYPYVI